MTFRAAFYKATRPGLQGVYSRLVRLVDGGPYSHCELVFSDGLSASASYIDGGVRFKHIEYDPTHWDFISMPNRLEPLAYNWFVSHQGAKYDLAGNVRFVAPWAIRDAKDRWFCSEAMAAAIGWEEPWRFGPSGLASRLHWLNNYAPVWNV